MSNDKAPSLREPDYRPWLGVIFAATALVYSHSLGNEFVFDDYDQIVDNRYLRDWSFLWKSLIYDSGWFDDPAHLPQSSYYRPLKNIWLWINFHLFGLHPASWHAASIALHLIVVWLVFRVASRLCASHTAGLLAAALFALMPLHAEAVVWAVATATLLNAALQLVAFDYYLRGESGAGGDSTRAPCRKLSIAWCAVAMLNYEGAVTFPILVAAHAFFLGEDGNRPNRKSSAAILTGGWLAEGIRRALVAAWPYALEIVGYFALRMWIFGFVTNPYPHSHPNTGSQAALTIPAALWAYGMLLLIPWRAGPAHRLDAVRSLASPDFYIPVVKLSVAAMAAVALFIRHPRRRHYLFCAAWIAIASAPALNLLRAIQPEAALDDRYLYFASVGLCVMAADIAVYFAREEGLRARAVWAVSGAALVTLALVLWPVQYYWHDDVTLFSQCVNETPGAEFCHNRLGVALAGHGDFSRASRQFEDALKIRPDDNLTRYSLALVYENLGDRKAAARTISEWVKRQDHPGPAAYTELALAAAAAGDQTGADDALKQAEAMPGGAAAAQLARAKILFLRGNRKAAESILNSILGQDPENVPALLALGTVLAADGSNEDALAAYRRAATLAPNETSLHYKIAVTLHNLGREREARDECRKILALSPDNPDARALMAAIERSGSD
ncbi:MAG TPA: tetratricopeptide repeat protein [Candidatus Binataceae bacterium]|nr:tetratricopeptide repeat protein [Candidatus Binataceae bacterium]